MFVKERAASPTHPDLAAVRFHDTREGRRCGEASSAAGAKLQAALHGASVTALPSARQEFRRSVRRSPERISGMEAGRCRVWEHRGCRAIVAVNREGSRPWWIATDAKPRGIASASARTRCSRSAGSKPHSAPRCRFWAASRPGRMATNRHSWSARRIVTPASCASTRAPRTRSASSPCGRSRFPSDPRSVGYVPHAPFAVRRAQDGTHRLRRD